ncbi:MAG: hypothetical protein ACYSWZ_19190 [Planctomycetota bacterium]|jgi:hypothetical protein
MNKEVQGYNIELIDFPNSQVVDQVRDRLFSKITSELHFYKGVNIPETNYREISFGVCRTDLGLREVHLEKSVGLDMVGYGLADVHPSKEDPVLEYCAVIIVDGTSFEALTTKTDRQWTLVYKNGKVLGKIHSEWCQTKPRFLGPCRSRWELYVGDTVWGHVKTGKHLLGKKFYLKDLVTRDSLRITTDNKTLLPIHLCREHRLVDFFRILFRLITLYPLWADKSKLVNKETVIPKCATRLTEPDMESFYFMINIVFRIVFFDMAFSYEMDS